MQISWLARRLVSWIDRYQRRGGSRVVFGIECNFEPTCSEYTKQAILRYGAWRGVGLGYQRIRRCNDPDCCEKMSDPLN